MSLLIKNAIIVNADKMAKQPQDIFIEKGVITAIASNISKEAAKTIDAKGKLVMPGLIDIHVHLREPGREDKETIATGSRSAAKGGFTTMMCMPNTTPVIDNALIVEGIIEEAKRVGLVNVIPIGAITRGQKDGELVDMLEMKKAGCLALSDDGKSVVNSRLMFLAMQYAKMADLLLIEHCQDPLLTSGGVMNEGFNSSLLGLKGDPGVAETVIVARDIELAHYLKTKVHLAHMSLKRSIELIRFAKSQGIQVTAEACPHHFTLTDDEVKSYNTHTKVNPPLRSQEDVEAVKEAIKDGTIDCIVTDHAPHTAEDKEVEFDHAPFGMIGLETSVGLTIRELVKPKILSWAAMVEKMSTAPARIVGLQNKGVIAEGKDADITIIDPDKEWVFKKEGIVSKSKNSPFIGQKMVGAVETTIYGGKVVYQAE
ncbi:MAG: dihydroorotase [Omnitrophica WOR_2 bacterium RIFCSPHIGHO2_01_FULL_48_9]|nr:MAG: dihydroorotase [Omnitrophica WOR_2 bacterium RIFCSPHIGHO2_02_FULL_48_11]OGX30228.1 MAG: dihydroorotase [Omnitrophica WOR_2 bacterium RIFCSPHIGHO2_01_FULL_48_9]